MHAKSRLGRGRLQVSYALGAMLVPAMLCAASPSSDRNGSLINSFQVMCNVSVLDFDRIASRATAMHMQVQNAQPVSADGGVETEHKAWLGQLTTGPFGLLLDRMSGPKGTVTSCAVIGPVPDTNLFRAVFLQDMRLQAPDPEIANGARSFTWPNVFGAGDTLILRDMTPSGQPGVMVKRVSMASGR